MANLDTIATKIGTLLGGNRTYKRFKVTGGEVDV